MNTYMTYTTYTTIFFDYGTYLPNKHKLENLRIRFNVVWDERKMIENVSYNEIVGIYKLFKTENRIIDDEKLRERRGATGLWKNERCALKVIGFDSCGDESLPILLIYRGDEDEFYRTLVSMCINFGCEIGRLVENDTGIHEVFKKKLSYEVVEKLKSKEVITELFDISIDELHKYGYIFGNDFIEKWKKCIKDYGYFSDDDLKNEIINKNVSDIDDNNETI